MDDTRRTMLLKHKDQLEKLPFDDHGARYAVIGDMFDLFGKDEDGICAGLIQLGEDMNELGMTLSSYPHRPNLICLMQTK